MSSADNWRIAKGQHDGHPFEGNQFTSASGGTGYSASAGTQVKSNVKSSKPVKMPKASRYSIQQANTLSANANNASKVAKTTEQHQQAANLHEKAAAAHLFIAKQKLEAKFLNAVAKQQAKQKLAFERAVAHAQKAAAHQAKAGSKKKRK